MKDITIAVVRSDQAAALSALQDAGVVHVVETARATGESLAVIRTRLETARRAGAALDAAKPSPTRASRRAAAAIPVAGDAGAGARATRPTEDVVAEVVRLADRLDDLARTRDELAEQQRRLAPFGAFDPGRIRDLDRQGIGVRLVRSPLKSPPPPVAGAVWVELARDRRHLTLALVGEREVVTAAELAEEVELPGEPPERIAQGVEQVDRETQRTRQRLADLGVERAAVERFARRTEDELRFAEARATMETVGAVVVLRGFVPAEDVARLRELARASGWGLWVGEIGDPATAPTLVRNPRWVRPIEPLFDFLGVLPGYGQVDVSVPFLAFFGLFFAMIVGDAGYGLVFLALTELAARRMPALSAQVVSLMRVMSIATIAWGIASGNYFGLSALPPVLLALRVDWLMAERNLIALAFTIGVVHLTLAHGWNVVRFANSTRALAELGWVATTWAMYFLARQLVLGDEFPILAWYLLAVGIALVVLFLTPWSEFRRGWFQHAMLPLTLVSNFVDVVSYVRLFAVGAATFAVAESFNALAMSIGLGGILGGLVSALVLFFGHTLNLLLAAMGVLVHGVRLNTLEFAGHLGLSWTGYPYRPLARSAPKGG